MHEKLTIYHTQLSDESKILRNLYCKIDWTRLSTVGLKDNKTHVKEKTLKYHYWWDSNHKKRILTDRDVISFSTVHQYNNI